MATIANLAKQKDGGFTGTLVLPSLDGRKIHFTPIEKKGKGPEFIVSVGGFEARLRELLASAEETKTVARAS